MKKLSVVISAYNEEKKIKDCLESIKELADEIIIVDNNSSDKTGEIAKKAGAKVFIKENNLMLNINKNYGFTKATGDWILCLDADERVSPDLVKEIRNCKLETVNSSVNGYWIKRQNIIFGKWIKHAGWYPDYQLRLFRNRYGRFPGKHVHEMIEVEGETQYLNNYLIHQNFKTTSQFIYKHAYIYAPNEADQLIEKGYQFKWEDAILFPSKEFISRFFAREGYKDGFHGLMLSMLMAFYHLLIFANIWEKNNFCEIKEEKFLDKINLLLKNINKEINYWLFLEKIKKIKNPITKTFLKLQSKFF